MTPADGCPWASWATDRRGGSERTGLDDLLTLVMRGLEPGVEVVQRLRGDGQRIAVLALVALLQAPQQLFPGTGKTASSGGRPPRRRASSTPRGPSTATARGPAASGCVQSTCCSRCPRRHILRTQNPTRRLTKDIEAPPRRRGSETTSTRSPSPASSAHARGSALMGALLSLCGPHGARLEGWPCRSSRKPRRLPHGVQVLVDQGPQFGCQLRVVAAGSGLEQFGADNKEGNAAGGAVEERGEFAADA